ncbi:CopK family periplasmic copper-binding protein [Zoogloea oleivorans]|uniref:CopK family periplasmic copper-binding protein n=1 Tax=Zoogloea oleivorans TaxID=1552750 RepID=UPI001FE827D8|nr:CopK family periplasmic copper-binding protein [Zoogloea oleivorans]
MVISIARWDLLKTSGYSRCPYIFKDGKMAMEDKYGRATRMKKETVMETKDGRKIIMHGDEVMRLDSLLRHGDGS